MFLQALTLYGRCWAKHQDMIQTRTAAQCRSHAQKYFAKLENEKAANLHGGAEELHGSHVVLEGNVGKGGGGGGKSVKKRRRRCGSSDASAASGGSAAAAASSAARGRKHKRKKSNKMKRKHGTTITTTASDRMGGSAAPAGGLVGGGARSILMMCQQGGLPAEPYCFASINPHSMMIPMRGPSPSVLQRAMGGARSPKTARAQGRALPGDASLLLGGAEDYDSELVSEFLRRREALVRPHRGSTKLPSHHSRIVVPPPSAAATAASSLTYSADPLAQTTIVPVVSLQKITDIDRQLLALYLQLTSRQTCMCRRLCYIVHCREAREIAAAGGVGSAGCITAQRNMLFLIQSSLVAYPVATPEASRLLQLWRHAQDSMQRVEMVGDAISIDQTATIYSTMSEEAQTQLHDLDETELTAVQVLVGTRMGLKPRKSPIRLGRKSSFSDKKTENDAASVSRTRSPNLSEDHVNKVLA